MSRIIAGSAKGRRLTAPKGTHTRPTTDRVKEALFSALASWFDTADEPPEHQLDGVAVLDLFAGSGALGLEAASRGAAPITCVDTHTAGLIRDNATKTGLRVHTVAGRAEHAVQRHTGTVDLVFVDPPYDMPEVILDNLLAELVAGETLTAQALVVVERSSRSAAPRWPDPVTRSWDRRYGETTLHFGATDQEQP
ncbi:16S rRNA (guanine(966)-N(2))-methyltransferase RsmD [Tessaracoccus antarcticus]|uniref:16S rRNA (Guanine(966)-N(2))-methyltransferase RsmD n=1 Tax=Tessaracoccus antarcticus TaxID=2479848 RepID=A0A3M0G4N5_9ACTN|nr:16S rRNA (guanine(966)-N(2))-methyltransferase RsmD [Tessaracoccus antarcticus]RMB59794.1 16S rRNA (guanine(966)-N(2))-methyltransferase RsmD [Tessaracoccus antarcticus]